MTRIFGYIFYHFYLLSAQTKYRNPRESALLFVLTTELFLIFPLLSLIIHYLTKKTFVLFLLAALLFISVKLYQLNFKWFCNKNDWKFQIQKYKNRSTLMKRIGYCVSIFSFFLSLIVGLLEVHIINRFF